LFNGGVAKDLILKKLPFVFITNNRENYPILNLNRRCSGTFHFATLMNAVQSNLFDKIVMKQCPVARDIIILFYYCTSFRCLDIIRQYEFHSSANLWTIKKNNNNKNVWFMFALVSSFVCNTVWRLNIRCQSNITLDFLSCARKRFWQ